MSLQAETLLLLGGLAWLGCSILNRMVFRPYMHDRLLFMLENLRHELQEHEAAHEASSDFCYRYINTGIFCASQLVRTLTLLEFRRLAKTDFGEDAENDVMRAMKKFDEEADDELRKIDRKITFVVIFSAITNSPLMSLALPVFVIAREAWAFSLRDNGRAVVHSHTEPHCV